MQLWHLEGLNNKFGLDNYHRSVLQSRFIFLRFIWESTSVYSFLQSHGYRQLFARILFIHCINFEGCSWIVTNRFFLNSNRLHFHFPEYLMVWSRNIFQQLELSQNYFVRNISLKYKPLKCVFRKSVHLTVQT